jgi:hypothetical protein
MAFVNLPPNLQDMFYAITDRIARLESGPNGAMTEATAAQSTAVQALSEAADANAQGVAALQEANIAIAQATYAIQTANTANANAIQATYVAGVAQTTANGKNTSHYSTGAPSGGGVAGDLWFTVDGGGTVLYQYAYNGSSWIAAPISNTVIANLDAGKITAGTITGIAYNNGSGTFSVSPSGNLVASSAIITGTIYATSGTFTGTVYASAGTFTGTITSSNATITGGTLTVGPNFQVTSSGILTASSANITGTITATSGSFSGTINATSGYFGSASNGWTITSTGISGTGSATISGGSISGATLTVGSAFNVSGSGFLTSTGAQIGPWYFGAGYIASSSGGGGYYWSSSTGALSTNNLYITGGSGTTISMSGGNLSTGGGNISTGVGNITSAATITAQTLTSNGALNVTSLATLSGGESVTGTSALSTVTVSNTITSTGDIYAQQAISSSTSAATNCYITTTGQIRKTSTTSSQRYKENITDIFNVPELNPKALLDLPVRAFTYKDGHIPATDDRANLMLPGFIAEEVDSIYPVAADYENGVETWNSFYIVPAMLALIQDQENRIKTLEGK